MVGQVVASASPLFKEGDWVSAYSGWQLYAKCHHSELTKLDPAQAPVSTALGVLGMPGRTAWFGLMDAGRPRPGDTLVVSGAAGAVGSLVAQFGKRAGCRVIGIAGGAAKCAFLTERWGSTAPSIIAPIRPLKDCARRSRQATGGVDIYFDNVGGMVTDAVIPLIKLRARIIICGAIAQYDGGLDTPDLAPRFLQHMLFKRATIQGILARDYVHRMDEMVKTVAPWVQQRRNRFAGNLGRRLRAVAGRAQQPVRRQEPGQAAGPRLRPIGHRGVRVHRLTDECAHRLQIAISRSISMPPPSLCSG